MEMNIEVSAFLSHYLWQLCVGVGLLLAVSEILIPGLRLMPLGLGFLVTAPVTMKPHSPLALVVFFVTVQALLFLLFRVAGKRKSRDRGFFSGMDSLVGCEARILPQRGNPTSNYVRVFGDRWRAVGPNGAIFQGGQRVQIRGYDGNTVLVAPMGNLEKNQ